MLSFILKQGPREATKARKVSSSPSQHEAAKDSNHWTWGGILAFLLCSTCHSSICLHSVLSESVTDDVLSKALVAKNLTQCGGDMVIVNSSAGPAAAAEKTPIIRTVIVL